MVAIWATDVVTVRMVRLGIVDLPLLAERFVGTDKGVNVLVLEQNAAEAKAVHAVPALLIGLVIGIPAAGVVEIQVQFAGHLNEISFRVRNVARIADAVHKGAPSPFVFHCSDNGK